jgi:hypothetical protein
MHINWGPLGSVFVVAFVSTAAVVVLVSFALVALSGRPDTGASGVPAVRTVSNTGKTVGGACLAAAALIVLYGLGVIVKLPWLAHH